MALLAVGLLAVQTHQAVVQVARNTRLVGHVVRGAVGLGGGGSHTALDVGRVLTERVGEAEVGDGFVVAVRVGSAEVRVCLLYTSDAADD